MSSKIFRIASVIVLAGFALSSAAWAATCSKASLSGTYGFLHGTTDSNGTPTSAAMTQLTTCTNAGVEGSFGFEATGVFLAGAPATGAVVFIGELKLTLNPAGEGVISGHVAAGEDSTFRTLAEDPVTGSYKVGADCRGTATITPKGGSEMHFSLVVVDGGNEMLALETDADTVVSGTLENNDLLQSL